MEILKELWGKKSYANDRRKINRKLAQARIDFKWDHLYDGYKWTFPWCPEADAVLHFGSYGNKKGHVETMGFPWDNDDVTELTPDEFVERLLDL